MMTMPDFLVIGVAKGGTTSLHAYLNQHPQIAMTQIKEPDFFEFGEVDQLFPLEFPPRPRAVQTLAEYQALFANLPPAKRYGEASPSNFWGRACNRISHYLPQARFICILRQPIERAYSMYAMHVRNGYEFETSFSQAYLNSIRQEQGLTDKEVFMYSQRSAAWYVERLQDWLTRFPRSQVDISLYEDLKADPVALMRKLYTFLEVDESFTPDISAIHNQGLGIRNSGLHRLIKQNGSIKRWVRSWMPRPLGKSIINRLTVMNRTPLPLLDPALRNELTRPQNADILHLQNLIGRDLTHWLAE